MQYPGRVVKAGEQDADIVRAVKVQLNQMLGIADDPALRLDPANPAFGPRVRQVVKLFQARHVDGDGRPLKQDGEIGSLTWAALFGTGSVVERVQAIEALLVGVLEVAAAEEGKGVREQPRNSNRGPQVDAYLKRVGLAPGHAWCCAFVYFCFDEASRSLGRANPMVRTAGCLEHWRRAPGNGGRQLAAQVAIADPAQVKPGMVFIMDHGRGLGHTGLVEKVAGGLITTIEGNTDASKTREGGGVYRLKRKLVEINKGFIDYGSA